MPQGMWVRVPPGALMKKKDPIELEYERAIARAGDNPDIAYYYAKGLKEYRRHFKDRHEEKD